MPRVYTLPQFNVFFDYWLDYLPHTMDTWGWVDPVDDPDGSTFGQLYLPQQTGFGGEHARKLSITPAVALGYGYQLRMSKYEPRPFIMGETFVSNKWPLVRISRDPFVEYFSCHGWGYAHYGFPNEYLIWYLRPYLTTQYQ